MAGGTPTIPPTLPPGIYLRDLNTSVTTLVSALPDGTPSPLFVDTPVISANGRYVSFSSWDDLDPNFPDKDIETTLPLDGPYSDVFVRDLQTSVTQTPDGIAGWTIGTPDTKGKLRAERSRRGPERVYYLTYEVTDRAGNTARAIATVLVPGW